MFQIAQNSVDGRLNRSNLCSGTEVASMQCARGLNHTCLLCAQNCLHQMKILEWKSLQLKLLCCPFHYLFSYSSFFTLAMPVSNLNFVFYHLVCTRIFGADL